MRDQPLLVTAIVLFVALAAVLRICHVVDRDHNGVADVEQKIVFADGYYYIHTSIMPFRSATVEKVDMEWVRYKAQLGVSHVSSGDGSRWADLSGIAN